MTGTQTAGDQNVHGTELTEVLWSEDEDPEHSSQETFFEKPGNLPADLSSATIPEEWLSHEASAKYPPVENADGLLNSAEFQEALEDLEFRNDLRKACQRVFHHHSQSTHSSWEDLQQEVLIRFGPWLPRYRKEANRRTVFARIATNVLIDAHRRETSKRRLHEEIMLEDLEIEPMGKKSGKEIEDRIFMNECRSILSETERAMFDEYFVFGKSLRQMAVSSGVSAAAMSKRWARLMKKFHYR